MALTAAERMKKYRERLKQNPEKYNEVKKKHAEYVKSKSKKVQELSETEKEKQRKHWRDQKRKQKQRKKQELQEEKKTPVKKNVKTEKKKEQRIKQLTRSYKAQVDKNEKLARIIFKYRKRLYRQKKETEVKVKKLEDQIERLKAREEVLEATLKKSYQACTTIKEKQKMKQMVLSEDVQKNNKKAFVAKLFGLKGPARIKNKKCGNNKVKDEIETFYIRDDISRMTAGKRQCRTSNKRKEQIRYLTDTVTNLHKIYREEGGKYSLATFFKYKPFFVLCPTIQNRETCLCIKHNNMEMLFIALKKCKVLKNYNTILDVVKAQCCDTNSKECMYAECKDCREKEIIYESLEENLTAIVEWSQWEMIDHKYTKTENKISKEITTKKTVKVKKVGTIKDLKSTFEKYLRTFKIHHFNWIYQQKQSHTHTRTTVSFTFIVYFICM